MKTEEKLGLKRKGTFSGYTIFTAFFTGAAFSMLGSMVAPIIYLDRFVLAAFGCFLAHWIISHSFHDLFHYTEEERTEISTANKKILVFLIIVSSIVYVTIAVYLTIKAGLLVIVFAALGIILSMYARHLLYHEAMYAFAGFFVVMGSFYVQTSYLAFDLLTTKALLIALFAFFTSYGWIRIYRLDHHGWNSKERNKGLYIGKLGILFLILYFLADKIAYELFV